MANFDESYASLDADSNVRGDKFEKKFVQYLFLSLSKIPIRNLIIVVNMKPPTRNDTIKKSSEVIKPNSLIVIPNNKKTLDPI